MAVIQSSPNMGETNDGDRFDSNWRCFAAAGCAQHPDFVETVARRQ